MKNNKYILLLGANGFIGKNIIDRYLENNQSLVLLNREQDKLDLRYQLDTRIKIVVGELSNIEIIKKAIIHFNIQTVIHLVSSMIPSSSDDQFYENLNSVVYPTFKLIDYLSQRGILFVFFSSGGTIYGKSKKPIKETNQLNPINVYGYSKLMIEQYIQFKHRIDGLKFIILRPSTLFGKYQKLDGKQGLISIVIKKIILDKEIEIWGNGKIVRDYIDVSNVVDVLVCLLKKEIINETINIGSGIGTNQLEIIEIIENCLNKKAKIVFKEKRHVDVDYMVLDIRKLQTLIDFTTKPITYEIKKYIELILENEK